VPHATRSIAGKYLGRLKVREGREAELSAQERKQVQKGSSLVDLDLREDGTFKKQATEGTWRVEGDRLVCSPTKFGGKTLQEMEQAAEEQGRAFGLRFVFFEFDLRMQGDVLVTSDDRAIVFTEYSRV
jgi:hypothetical protein